MAHEYDYDILIPGNYFCDLIFTDVPRFPALGAEVYTGGLTVTLGGCLNTVIALRRLGVRVGWRGCVGADFFSRYVLETVAREGVDTALLHQLDTPLQRVTVAVSFPHDRAFVTYVDTAPNSIDLLLATPETLRYRHLHLTGLTTDPRAPEVLAAARARGATVSMDCQDRPVTLETPGVREVLTQLDIFMPNAREAMQLTGAADLHAAAAVLRALVPLLVIKDGAGGAYAWRQENDHAIHAPAIDVLPLDTTGAGDVFNAGFLAARLAGSDLATCMRWGSVCGGLSTLGVGGAASAPAHVAVLARL